MTDCNYQLQYSPNGSVQWLLPKPWKWTSSIRQSMRYRAGEPQRPSKWPAKLVYFFVCFFICCCSGSRWGNMEGVVARWQRPVASGVALDMPHQAMPSVLLQHTPVIIETANNGGAFVCHPRLFCMIIRSYKTMLWSIKINAELQY